jgi:hypothetical protein
LLGIDNNLDIDSCNDTKELSKSGGSFDCFPNGTKKFQSYPTKERKIFQHKNIDQIDRI